MNDPKSRLLAIASAAGAAWLRFASPALAQETIFHPSVELEEAYSDNIQYAGATTPVSDWSTRIGLTLPLQGEWSRGSWGLTYAPSYEKHQDLSVLDHAEHRFGFNLASRIGRSATLACDAYAARTQVQGRSESLESPDLFLTTRTNRDLFGVDLRFTKEMTARWRWHAAAGGSSYNYSAIPNFDPGANVAPVQDRTEYHGALGFARLLSRASSLGVEYEHRNFDLDTGGTETADLLGVTVDHMFSEQSSMSLRIGGFQRSTDGTAIPSGNSSGVQGGFSLKRAFRSSNLTFAADVSPSSGGSLTGTATDSSAGLVFTAAPGLRWAWNVSTRYAHRDPTDPATPSVSSVGAGAGIEWRPNTRLGFRMAVDYLDQSGSTQPGLNTSVTSGSAGIVWYPRGYAREKRGARV